MTTTPDPDDLKPVVIHLVEQLVDARVELTQAKRRIDELEAGDTVIAEFVKLGFGADRVEQLLRQLAEEERGDE